MTTSRRKLLGQMTGLLAGAVVAPTLIGCGDDDDTPLTDSGTPTDNGSTSFTCASPAAEVGAPLHGHEMTVSMADVDAGAMKVYDIMGSAGHTHSVTITAAGFTTLKSAGTLMVTSTMSAGHSHVVTVTCAS